MAAITNDPPHLKQLIDRFYRGETLRLAIPLGGIEPTTVTAADFALELETGGTPRLVVTMAAGDITLIDAAAVDPQPVPALAPGTTVYEVVIDTQAAGLPSGFYRFDGWITYAFGRRTVCAGRLHLREPALS